jgi:hypothetical protein
MESGLNLVILSSSCGPRWTATHDSGFLTKIMYAYALLTAFMRAKYVTYLILID